jgi:tRNA threonylcarbamoyladenosine biosynthesis protein TsaE
MTASPSALDSRSPEETFALGRQLGAVLQPGDFVGLVGDLGAGKTQLVRGVAAGVGVPEGQVASPTFAVVYPYQGRLPLYHADFYRLSGWDELYGTGFLDLLQEPAAFLVEWVDRIPRAAPRDWLRVSLERVNDTRRRIELFPFGPGAEALAQRWRTSVPSGH